MQKIFSFLFFILLGLGLNAQDRLFSQFYASPFTLNPALTGAFEGRFRVAAIYRDQWRAAMEKPYATFSTSLDIKWRMGGNKAKYKDYAAVGLMFYNDKAGSLNYSTSQISVSGAYHKSLDNRNTQYLSIGFQGGIAQRNLNYADITFEDQFNGATGYTDPTQERLPENNFTYGDYSVGLNYVFSPRYSRTRFFVGAAMHHFLTPSIGFFYRSNPDANYAEVKLDARYAAQFSAVLPITKERLQLLPRVIFDLQGDYMKMDAGTNLRINTSSYKNIALHIGAYARPVNNQDNNIRVDALVALLGIEFNNVLFGFSYDLNLGEVTQVNRRAFEISVAYLGEYEDDLILCPKF
ncbi:MAG: PorP/SprF family type IX secretion system membrane protein [Saprospiraceae bacterium]|nr:PorP/SprF family type IX secretion system membrane protein [Saprospiraceae bacterium]